MPIAYGIKQKYVGTGWPQHIQNWGWELAELVSTKTKRDKIITKLRKNNPPGKFHIQTSPHQSLTTQIRPTGITMNIKPGQTVRIHPASDWFMRGEQYATVIRLSKKHPTVYVQGNRSNKKWWELKTNILSLDKQPIE